MLQAYDLPQPVLESLEALKNAATNFYNTEDGLKRMETDVAAMDKELVDSHALDNAAEAQRSELGERGGVAMAHLYMAFKLSYANGTGAFTKFIENMETLSDAKSGKMTTIFKTLFNSFWQNPEMYGPPKKQGPLAYKEIRRQFQKNGIFKQWFDRVNIVHWKVIPYGRPGDAINDFRDNYRCSLIKETITNFYNYNKSMQKKFTFLGIDFSPPSERKLAKRYFKVWNDFFDGDMVNQFEQQFRQEEAALEQKLETKKAELSQAREVLAPMEEEIKEHTMKLLGHFPNTQEIVDKLYSIYQASDLSQTAIEARSHLHNAYNKIQLPSYEEYTATQQAERQSAHEAEESDEE